MELIKYSAIACFVFAATSFANSEPLSEKIMSSVKEADAKLGKFVDTVKEAGIRRGQNFPIFIQNQSKDEKSFDMYGTHCNVSNGGPEGYTNLTLPPKSTTQFTTGKFEEFCTFTLDDKYVSSWKLKKGRYLSLGSFTGTLNIVINDEGVFVGTKKFERYYPE